VKCLRKTSYIFGVVLIEDCATQVLFSITNVSEIIMKYLPSKGHPDGKFYSNTPSIGRKVDL